MSERYTLRPGRVEWRQVEGEIVALDVEASEYLAVNSSGAVLWERLVAGVTTEELVGELQARYGIDEATAAGDVAAFLDQLRGRGVLDVG